MHQFSDNRHRAAYAKPEKSKTVYYFERNNSNAFNGPLYSAIGNGLEKLGTPFKILILKLGLLSGRLHTKPFYDVSSYIERLLMTGPHNFLSVESKRQMSNKIKKQKNR